MPNKNNCSPCELPNESINSYISNRQLSFLVPRTPITSVSGSSRGTNYYSQCHGTPNSESVLEAERRLRQSNRHYNVNGANCDCPVNFTGS